MSRLTNEPASLERDREVALIASHSVGIEKCPARE